jgi:hypothetical protein
MGTHGGLDRAGNRVGDPVAGLAERCRVAIRDPIEEQVRRRRIGIGKRPIEGRPANGGSADEHTGPPTIDRNAPEGHTLDGQEALVP